MTPGRDGKRRPSGLSRRQLLTGIGGVGAVGMASGLGTGAYLSDRATFSGNAFGAGSVELTVDDNLTDGLVTIGVSGIGRGPDKRASDSFRVGVRTNPARVWLAAKCPTVDTELVDALDVDVLVEGRSITNGLRPLATVAAELVDGERIDDGCLDPGDSLTVEVVAGLPDDAVAELAGTHAALTFRLYAEQCRHVSEADADASNPFAGLTCDEPDPVEETQCGVCADGKGSLLSLDVRYLGGAPASLIAVSTKGGTSGTLYEGTTQPGDVFTLDGSDVVRNGNGGPGDRLGPEVEIAVDGGSTTAIHTSCSQPIAVGLRFGDGGLFEIAGGTTTDGEPLCGSEDI